MPSQLTQDSLIQALTQLRHTHPSLPAVAWSISDFPDVVGLEGRAFGPNAVDVMLAYAEVLGGEIVPKHTFEVSGQRMQSLRLDTVFAEVRVVICGGVPAPELTLTAVAA